MLTRLEERTAINMGSWNLFDNPIKLQISQQLEPFEPDPVQRDMFDQISISLQAHAAETKAQNPPLHGGFKTYEGIDWECVNYDLTNALQIDDINSVCFNYVYNAELSIEILAAQYALYFRDINSSSMSDNDKSMAIDRLNSIFDVAKHTMGDVLQKQLSDFLAKGGVNGGYSDISAAIGQIVDIRAEAYKSIYDDFRSTSFGRSPGGLNSADTFVMMMYSNNYTETQMQGNSYIVADKYTYSEIKAAFKATAKLTSQLRGFGDAGQVLFSQEETALIAGIAVMYYSAITEGINSKSGLLADIKKSLFNQIKVGADKWKAQLYSHYSKYGNSINFSTDYVLSTANRFAQLANQQNFNANLLKLLLEMRSSVQAHWGSDPFDKYSQKLISNWNEWAKANSNDSDKYIIGFNSVA